MPENVTNICPNCDHENSPEYRFCENCGQKNRPLRITFLEFVSDFFDVVFNLDNRFWRTLRQVFIPGKLTKTFFQGKRKSFYHPLRLYLVSVLLFFTTLSLLKLDNVIQTDNGTLNFGERYNNKKLLRDQGQHLITALDSLKSVYPTPSQQSLIDSIEKEIYLVHNKDTIYINNEAKTDTNYFKFISTEVNYTNEELFNGDIDEIVASKNLNNFFDRLAFRQYLKAARDLNSLNKFLFANLTWLFLALIPGFALVLKLFYIRRNRYYMEHFVFLLHLFTAIILITAIILAIFVPLNEVAILSTALSLLAILFPFLAFKNYYQQGILKTFVKFVALGIVFTIVFTLTFTLFLVITAALF